MIWYLGDFKVRKTGKGTRRERFKRQDKHMGCPLYVTFCFSLAAFNILYLCLVFVSLINMCLGMFLFGFILYGTLCASWTWLTISFSMVGKFPTIISSKIFSYPFFFSSSSGTHIIQMLVSLILLQRFLRLSSVLFILFTLFCSSEVVYTILSSSSLFFCFRYSAIDCSSVQLLSCVRLFATPWTAARQASLSITNS